MATQFLVFTSDGELHKFDSEEDAIDCIDSYGPEVVDHNLPDGSIVECSPIWDLVKVVI